MTDVRVLPDGSTRAGAKSSSKTPTPTGPVDATNMDGKQVDKLIAAGWHTDPKAHNNVLLPPPGGAGSGSFNCLPWDAEALSRHGFVPFSALNVGDEILGYDMATGRTEWTPVLALNVYADAPMIRLSNRRFDVMSTPNHNWVVRGSHDRLVSSADVQRRHSVLIAAPADGGSSPITPRDAALLGWLVTDGSVTTYRVGRYGPYKQAVIAQSKPSGILRLRELCGSDATERTRTAPADLQIAGVLVKSALVGSTFQFPPSFTADLLARAGMDDHRADLPTLIPSLSVEARRAMLDAMLDAEGSPHATGMRFYQRPGPVLDAFLMLCALEGRRTGRIGVDKRSGVCRVTLRSTTMNPVAEKLSLSAAPSAPAWCPTTALGTWVARLNGQVFITGNSKHPRAAKGNPTGGQFVVAQGSGGNSASPQEKATVTGVRHALGLKGTGAITPEETQKIKDFQKAHGLLVDGKVGTQTAAAILGKKGKHMPGKLTTADQHALSKRSALPSLDSFRHTYRTALTAEEQIQSGIDYIQRRYGSPDAASAAYARMAHEQVLGDKVPSPGLFHHKGKQLPAYMQHVINDLIEGGTPRELAIPRGIGIVKNWAEGHDGKGHNVHPDTVAKAVAAVAEWEADKAEAHATKSGRTHMFSRTFNLEDISVRSGAYEDGRTVEAYAAVFDVPTPIRDHEGEYVEVIDRACFDRAVDHARPQGGRQSWKCGVFYNHARTIFGTPSDRHSEPIGVCLDIKPDARGLLTVTRYLPAADNILDAIREGAITSYSFSGAFRRSTPQITGHGRYRPSPSGELTQVRRHESSLREYGPTPFPAYDEAEVVGMRAQQIAMALGTLDRGERDQLVEILRSDAVLLDDTEADMQDDEPSGTPTDGTASGDSQDDDLHSTRNHTNRLWRSRLRDALADRGIALSERERQK